MALQIERNSVSTGIAQLQKEEDKEENCPVGPNAPQAHARGGFYNASMHTGHDVW